MSNNKSQFYNEGLATTFYLKPKNFINKNVKNKFINKLLNILLIFIYTLCALTVAGLYLYLKLK